MELYLFVIFLGILQGLTEFLPISSSGHLALSENIPFFQKQTQELENALPLLAFNVFIHLGTILAVIQHMLAEIKSIFLGFLGLLQRKKEGEPKLHLGVLTIVGTMPLIIVPWLKPYVEKSMKSLVVLGYLFLINSLLLLSANILFRRVSQKKSPKTIGNMTLKEAFFIGLFQALAVFPGISRSGATITAALFLHFSGTSSVHFSFLLSIPALIGATLFEIWDILEKGGFNLIRMDLIFLGVLSSYIAGIFSIRFLAWLGKRMLFYPFGIYTAFLSFIILLLNRHVLV